MRHQQAFNGPLPLLLLSYNHRCCRAPCTHSVLRHTRQRHPKAHMTPR